MDAVPLLTTRGAHYPLDLSPHVYKVGVRIALSL